MGYFLQFGYWRLRTVVRDSLSCIFVYVYIYMYRYNTVLVNKVGGFHMADRGTELRTLFPPQTCLVNSSFCYIFFLSSQISIMQPFCFHPHKSYSCPMYTFIAGFYPTGADSCQDRAKRYLEKSRFRKYRSQVCFVMTGLHIPSS